MTTWIILVSERRAIVHAGNSEGDTKFLYAMKLVPPKDEWALFIQTIHWQYYS